MCVLWDYTETLLCNITQGSVSYPISYKKALEIFFFYLFVDILSSEILFKMWPPCRQSNSLIIIVISSGGLGLYLPARVRGDFRMHGPECVKNKNLESLCKSCTNTFYPFSLFLVEVLFIRWGGLDTYWKFNMALYWARTQHFKFIERFRHYLSLKEAGITQCSD